MNLFGSSLAVSSLTKICRCVLAISVSAIAATAGAQDGVSAATRDSLIREQGYSEIVEGFFVKRVGLQESYLAVGAAGNLAMVEKLMESRNARQQAILKQGGDAEEVVAKFNGIIDRLIGSGLKTSASQTGNCSGTQGSPDFYVSAQASGGIFALANAGNNVGTVNTTNHTESWTTNKRGDVTSSQVSTTYGVSSSHSQVSIPDSAMACESIALATVKCPGYSNPSLSLFINQLKWWDCRN